jgi:Fe-S-cluster containining protein
VADRVSLTITTPLPTGPIELVVIVPAGPTRPADVLPAFYDMTNRFVEAGVQSVGGNVSCRKGCGACCRQVVPVSEIEAYSLSELVEAMPEPLRSDVKARFAAAGTRFDEAGLGDVLNAPAKADIKQLEALQLDYFRVGVPCPFLDEESCSIHPDRPAMCREYLVTSPAENCQNPDPTVIKRVPVAARVSRALRVFDADGGTTMNHWVPLVKVLDWVKQNPDRSEPKPGPDLVRQLYLRLATTA